MRTPAAREDWCRCLLESFESDTTSFGSDTDPESLCALALAERARAVFRGESGNAAVAARDARTALLVARGTSDARRLAFLEAKMCWVESVDAWLEGDLVASASHLESAHDHARSGDEAWLRDLALGIAIRSVRLGRFEDACDRLELYFATAVGQSIPAIATLTRLRLRRTSAREFTPLEAQAIERLTTRADAAWIARTATILQPAIDLPSDAPRHTFQDDFLASLECVLALSREALGRDKVLPGHRKLLRSRFSEAAVNVDLRERNYASEQLRLVKGLFELATEDGTSETAAAAIAQVIDGRSKFASVDLEILSLQCAALAARRHGFDIAGDVAIKVLKGLDVRGTFVPQPRSSQALELKVGAARHALVAVELGTSVTRAFSAQVLGYFRQTLRLGDSRTAAPSLVALMAPRAKRLKGMFGKLVQQAVAWGLASPELRAEVGDIAEAEPRLSFISVTRILRRELGANAELLISGLGKQPIGAGTVAQVHRGSIDGRTIAVKVLYPAIRKALQSDVDLIEFFKPLFRFSFPGGHVSEVFAELSRLMLIETDLRAEAEIMATARRALAAIPGARVPEIDAARSTGEVLTMEWARGIKWSEFVAEAPQTARNRIAEVLFRVVVTGRLKTGLTHWDLHLGNVLPTLDGDLWFIDWGGSHVTPPAYVDALRGQVLGLLRGDEGIFAKANAALGVAGSSEDYDHRLDFRMYAEMWREFLAPEPTPLLHASGEARRRAWLENPNRKRATLPPAIIASARSFNSMIGLLSDLGVTLPWRRYLEEIVS